MAHRILTTHVGSLPRPERVVTQLFAQDSGLNYVETDFDTTMAAEVVDVVARQAKSRVDVVSDGEMSKISYATYIRHRLTGFTLGEMPRAVPGRQQHRHIPAVRRRLVAQPGTHSDSVHCHGKLYHHFAATRHRGF